MLVTINDNDFENLDDFIDSTFDDKILVKKENLIEDLIKEEFKKESTNTTITRYYLDIWGEKNCSNYKYFFEKRKRNLKFLLVNKILNKFQIDFRQIEQTGIVETDEMCHFNYDKQMVFKSVRWEVKDNKIYFTEQYYLENENEITFLNKELIKYESDKYYFYLDEMKYQLLEN